MGNNMREDIIGLDLNQEPLEQPQYSVVGLESILNELETAQGRIEERIRQVEAVTARARQRRRWHQEHTPPVVNITALAAHHARNDGAFYGSVDPIAGPKTTPESGKRCTHLIAKALEMDSGENMEECLSGDFFDCNICLDMAVDPILTCCGHLFCWPCFYHWPSDPSDVKECPVCGGEVTESNLVPIYGNGDGNYSRKSKESGLEFPPRPQARRVESMRQHRINRGLSSSRIEERIQQLTNLVGTIEQRTGTVPSRYRTSQLWPFSNQRHDAVDFSRQILQGAASFSSLSSALSSSERLVEDLESYSNGHQTRTSHQQSPPRVDDGDQDAASVFAVITQAESQTSDIAAGSSSSVLPSSLALTIDIASDIRGIEDQTTNSEINETELSSSSRRIPVAARGPRETRRRRLR